MTPLPVPIELGYRMPAEWEPHAATWLTWPRPDGISFPDGYEAIPEVYARLIQRLTLHEAVHINVWDGTMAESIRAVLRRHHVPVEAVYLHEFQSYEPWCRDHGPIFIVRDSPAGRDRAVVDWDYNAWGGKYPPYDLDDAIPPQVAHLRGLPLFSPGIVLEGGSIEVNGTGTLLTTEACLLNPNRNPHLTRHQIERYLRDFLGATHILWLGEGIVGDDTDGHIDDLARFLNPTTIATVVEEDPSDENHGLLQDNLQRLRHMKDAAGHPFRIVELPMPGVVERDGQRLPASYANFYIANRQVLLPTFRHPNDRIAQERLQREFPDREVVPMDSTDLIWGLGSFHCISQQEPA
jgi:agmatine deiminase